LAWLTANIGIHHIHHLASRIPYYHLQDVLRDFPELANIRRLTFIQSLSCIKLRLWDEDGHKLVSFSDAKAIGV
jgi:omega-6 fatty acid desaturase (delta-12 desaturase)